MTTVDEEKHDPVSEREDAEDTESQAFLPQNERSEEPKTTGVNKRYWFSVAINTASAVGLVGETDDRTKSS